MWEIMYKNEILIVNDFKTIQIYKNIKCNGMILI